MTGERNGKAQSLLWIGSSIAVSTIISAFLFGLLSNMSAQARSALKENVNTQYQYIRSELELMRSEIYVLRCDMKELLKNKK